MTKTTRREPEIHKPITKEVLYSLQSEYQWLDLLKNRQKPYNKLIDIVQKEAKRNDEDYSPRPSIKQIADLVGETSAKVTRWLNQMYFDLWELNLDSPELFKTGEKLYHLYIKSTYTNQTASFYLWLDKPLNHGDKFNWYFTKGLLGVDYFFVSDISHQYSQGKQETMITLKSGFYNSYRETLLHKAEFMDLLSLDERFHLNEYQLDILLRERVAKGKDVGFETIKSKNYFKGSYR